jgi:hypothetical protein
MVDVFIEHLFPPWRREEAWDFCKFRRGCSDWRVWIAGSSRGDDLNELQAAVSICLLHDDSSASRKTFLKITTGFTKFDGLA